MKTLKIVLPVALITLCFSTRAFAGPIHSFPEINPADGVAAVALLGGALTIFRSRLKR